MSQRRTTFILPECKLVLGEVVETSSHGSKPRILSVELTEHKWFSITSVGRVERPKNPADFVKVSSSNTRYTLVESASLNNGDNQQPNDRSNRNWYSRRELNSHHKLRKLKFYPLNYESVKWRRHTCRESILGMSPRRIGPGPTFWTPAVGLTYLQLSVLSIN